MTDNANDRWVEVSGEGTVSAAPDFARVTLGVTSAGKTAGEAMAANAKAANTLMSLIKAEGIAPADIQTTEVSISPVFSQSSSSQTNPPTITGYSVSNNVTVVVRDIPRVGALLDKAVTAAANSVYGIGFGHNDPGALLDKARPLAVADARGKAEIYASGGRQDRPAHGAHRGRRIPTAHRLFSRLCRGRPRADTDRGGRGQADRHHHGAVRADAVSAGSRRDVRRKRARRTPRLPINLPDPRRESSSLFDSPASIVASSHSFQGLGEEHARPALRSWAKRERIV